MSLALAAKNGLFGDVLDALERNLDRRRSASCGRRSVVPCCSRSHLRAIAPAPTVGAVSRADARPPPRGSRRPYLWQVGVVGVAGAEGVEQVRVVLAALVGVADQQADRRAGGPAFEHAGQDLDLVGLVALRDVARGAGAAPVELGLDVGLATAPCPGGQPSTTQPIAGPWLSPKLVTRNSVPRVLPDISADRRPSIRDSTTAARRGSRPASRGCRP